jgi:hypothetical protein
MTRKSLYGQAYLAFLSQYNKLFKLKKIRERILGKFIL